MNDGRLLVGFLVVLGVAVSFALTVFLFGFVVLAGLLLAVAGLALLATSAHRRTGRWLLTGATVTLSGPLVYVALAFL